MKIGSVSQLFLKIALVLMTKVLCTPHRMVVLKFQRPRIVSSLRAFGLKVSGTYTIIHNARSSFYSIFKISASILNAENFKHMCFKVFS